MMSGIPVQRIAAQESNKLVCMGDELKKQFLDAHVDIDNIFAVFDDRQKVVDMWRNNGLLGDIRNTTYPENYYNVLDY